MLQFYYNMLKIITTQLQFVNFSILKGKKYHTNSFLFHKKVQSRRFAICTTTVQAVSYSIKKAGTTSCLCNIPELLMYNLIYIRILCKIAHLIKNQYPVIIPLFDQLLNRCIIITQIQHRYITIILHQKRNKTVCKRILDHKKFLISSLLHCDLCFTIIAAKEIGIFIFLC